MFLDVQVSHVENILHENAPRGGGECFERTVMLRSTRQYLYLFQNV